MGCWGLEGLGIKEEGEIYYFEVEEGEVLLGRVEGGEEKLGMFGKVGNNMGKKRMFQNLLFY